MQFNEAIMNYFNFIAIGQCGCRIVKEFNKIGFSACYINSDSVDMRNLGVPENRILLLDMTGSGRSPSKGKLILEKNYDKFVSFIERNVNRNAINVVVIGLGGGTGGGMAKPVIEYIKSIGLKVGVIATLPPKLAGMLDLDNAMKSLKELKDLSVQFFILIDNELLINKVGVSADWWQKINYYILMQITSVFDIVREDKSSQAGFGSIDIGEILRIFQYGKGFLDIHDVMFTVPRELDLEDDILKRRLLEPTLISGYEYKNALFYMINVDIPKKSGYTSFASRIFGLAKNTFGSSLSRIGMFNDPVLDNVVRVNLIIAGLRLPKVLKSRIHNLKRDSDRYGIKIAKGDSINLDEVDVIGNFDDNFEI